MRHRCSHRNFHRPKDQRRALFKGLASSLLKHGKVCTTLPKAKDLRGVVERLITTAKEDTLARRRKVYGYIPDKQIVFKLFTEIAPQFKQRPGGYTRIIKTAIRRPGDNADMAIIELVQEKTKRSSGGKKGQRKKEAEAA